MTDYTYDQYVPGKGQAKSNAHDSSPHVIIKYLTLGVQAITLCWIVTSLYSSHCQKILSDWPIPSSRILLDLLIITQIVKTLSKFMEPKGALSCPQQPITGPCHESDISESTPSHPISGRSNLILYSHLCWPTYSDKWHAKIKSCLKLQLFNRHCLPSCWTECSNTRPTTQANLTTHTFI